MSASPDHLRSDAARNRASLLDAARAELAENAGSLRLRDVARRAGVGQGTMYRHFPSREALLSALTLDRLERLVVSLEATARSGPLALEGSLRATLLLSLDTGRDPTFTEVLSGAAASTPETAGLRQRLGRALEVIVGHAHRTGLISLALDAGDVLRLICGTQHAVAMAADDPALPERYTEVLLAALRPQRKPLGRR